MRRALIVGIDDYNDEALSGCVNDAIEIASVLEKNGDGSPNFGVLRMTSNDYPITSELLSDALEELFAGDADIALFYFAGHGIINPETNAGHIVSMDGTKPNWGIALSEILELANSAYPRLKSSVIILDSCQSGFMGEPNGIGSGNEVSTIGNGVTILTACDRLGYADEEDNAHGKFTSILLDGLTGASADIIGRITPASLYTHVDQTLGPWGQQPIYKANVKSFITLRTMPPKIQLEVLRRLVDYFPNNTDVFPLDPSCEKDRGAETDNLKHIPFDPDKEKYTGNFKHAIVMA